MKTKAIIALTAALIGLCVLQFLLYTHDEPVSTAETDVNISENEIYIEGIEPIDEQGNIYDKSGYIVNNTQKFTERLNTEVNNMANDRADRDHIYDVAMGLWENAKSYYTVLGNSYEDDAYDLVDDAKSYVFNSEALAYNIMVYIKEGKTEYISRAMMCLSADSALLQNFRQTQEVYRQSHITETTTEALDTSEAQTE